jgi:hypothetical protein
MTTAQTTPAARLGLEPGQVVQEIGYADDVDHGLREGIESVVGQDLVDEDYDDVADVVLLWFREEDGDLTDALVDAIGLLAEGGDIWLFSPKTGRAGHIESSDIADAAHTAGLSQTKSLSITADWNGTRLSAPKPAR